MADQNRSGRAGSLVPWIAGLSLAGCLAVLAGCAGGRGAGEPNTGLAHLAEQTNPTTTLLEPGREADLSPLAEMLRRQEMAALDIEAALRNRESRETARPTEPPPVWGERRERPAAVEAEAAEEPPEEVDASAEPEPEPEPEETPVERRWRLVDELSALLLSEAGMAEEPFEPLGALAALEAVAPGALERARARDETGFSLLFPSQEAMLGAMQDLVHAWRAGDPDEAADAAQRVADRLRDGQGLRLPRVALCRRVEGFGRYEPFARHAFLAGREQEMILYVEADGFAHAPARWRDRHATPGRAGSAEPVDAESADAFAVELTQSVQLWRDRDNLLVWSQPVQRDRWVSRNRVRDFYLVNRVILPASVTTGRYTLKVIMRDVNQPGAVVEAAIPLEFVSDPRLVE